MKTAVVISTAPGREAWVRDCLESIKSPAIVISTGGYELGKLKWVYTNTSLDKFVFLQDSIIVRNEPELLRLLNQKGSTCLMDVPRCLGSYLGIYEREILDKVEIPEVTTKEESIRQEIEWTAKYKAQCEVFNHPQPSIEHTQVHTVYRHGRQNLLYVNRLYEKWKGTWR